MAVIAPSLVVLINSTPHGELHIYGDRASDRHFGRGLNRSKRSHEKLALYSICLAGIPMDFM